MDKATAISCRGTRAFIRAVNTYCEDHETTTADFVKAAILEKVGKDLDPYLKAFNALNGQQNIQSDIEKASA